MNSDLVHPNGKAAVQPDWAKQFDDWRRLLARCKEKGSRRRVHALRVATLRLKAEVDFRLLDPELVGKISDAARRWNKQADKLRKALSPVRDTDVHIELLEKLCVTNGTAEEKLPLAQACIAEASEVSKKLRKEREASADDLLKEIHRREARLESTSKKLQKDLAKQTAWAESDRSLLIRGIVAALAPEVSVLSGDTLHEFRKQAKTARYLADISAKRDPRAARQAALLKKMQNAAGQWHDIQTLAVRAEEILGKGSNEVVPMLKTLAQSALDGALDVCRSTVSELLAQGAWIGANGHRSSLPPKKPVQGVKASDLGVRHSIATIR